MRESKNTSGTNEPISIIIVEDDAKVIQLLEKALDSPSFSIMHIFMDLTEARGYFSESDSPAPRILMVSLEMIRVEASYNLNYMRTVKQALPDTRVIIMAERCVDESVLSIVREGIKAFILKKDLKQYIAKCVKVVDKEEVWFKAPIVSRVFDEFHALLNDSGVHLIPPNEADYTKLEKLTKRELELLKLIAVSLTNEEIADRTFISPDTVKTHVRNIFEKLEVRNRVEATLLYLGATRTDRTS